jgi:hypothetical protein
MWVDTPNPDQVLKAAVSRESLIPRQSIVSSPYDASAEYGFGDAFGAAFLHENTVVSALHAYSANDTATEADIRQGRAENFNPYSWLKQSQTPEVLQQLAPAINAGEFEGAVSQRAAQAAVADLLYEADLQRKMAASPWGALAGSLVTSLLDPTTYIPLVGQAARIGRLGKIGLFALNASLSAGASEAVLQATQRSRSVEESLMNIGTAGVLGGGMGIFAAALHKSMPLHPDNVDNPLRIENLDKHGEVYRTPDGAHQDVIDHTEITALRNEATSDLGAAAAPRPEIEAASLPNRESEFRATRFFNSQTIAGRIVRAGSKAARMVGLRLMDPGGILMDLNLNGKALKPSAEAIKKDYGVEIDQLYDGMARRSVAVNQKVEGKKVQHSDVLLMTQRKLFNMPDPELEGTLNAKYGPDSMKLIDEAAGKNAEEIHALNDVWEKRLRKEGLLQDTARVAALQGEVGKGGSLPSAIDKHPGNLPEATPEQKTELRHLRNQADLKRRDLAEELAKAAPLGRNYGHAQLWNRESIIESPQDFKAFLMDAFAVDPSPEWLHETHLMTADNLAALRQEDVGAYRQILQEWAGDEHYWRISRLEQELDAVNEASKSAKLDLSESLVAAHAAKRDEGQLSLSEARTRRDAVMTRLETARARKRALGAQMRGGGRKGAVVYHGSPTRGLQTVGANQTTRQPYLYGNAFSEFGAFFTPEKHTAQRYAGEKGHVYQALLDLQKPYEISKKEFRYFTEPFLTKEGKVAPDRAAREKELAQEAATRRQELEAQGYDGLLVRNEQGAVTEMASFKDVPLGDASAETVARHLNQATTDLAVLEERSARLNEKLRKVEDLHTEETSMRRQLEEDVRRAREDRGIAEKDVRSVKRALLKTKKQTPMEDMVDKVVANLTRTGTIGPAIMDRINELGDRTTGRVKERVISLNPEMRAEAIKKGWLNQDLSKILFQQYDQLGAELGIREGVGIGPGRTYATWDHAVTAVRDDYNQMIATAADKATKDRLRSERDIIADDIVEARNRLKGNHDDDGTTSGWLKWGSSKLRQANYIRYGGGFLLSSLTDTATVALRHPDFLKYIGPAIREMRAVGKADHSALRSMIQSVELGMGAAASARRFGAEDLINGAYSNYGIGFGRTRRITGTIDKGFDKVGHAVSTYSGLPIWNRFWKTVSGIAMSDKLNKMVMGYGKLKPSEVADLASLGIGKAEAERMAKFLGEHGKTSPEGRFEPHMEKWGDSSAAQAASRDFRIAIMRDMDRAINTPGIGDTPRLMSKWYAKLLLQFQTFAFTFLNRYAYPVAQRTSLFKERAAIMSMSILFASATVVVIGHDLINGRNPEERFQPQNLTKTLHEIVDRSGFLGWTSPYADGLLKLSSPITGYGGTNRYARNSAVDSMLGVNFALVHDIDRALGAAVSRDPKLVQKLLVLAPFSTQARLFYNQLLNNK